VSTPFLLSGRGGTKVSVLVVVKPYPRQPEATLTPGLVVAMADPNGLGPTAAGTASPGARADPESVGRPPPALLDRLRSSNETVDTYESICLHLME
jgi:hypothetical protein